MRFEINAEINCEKIGLDYRRKILSLFKMVLEGYNHELKELIYNNNKMKNFTFAPKLSIEKIENNEIFFKNKNMKIILSVEDPLLALHFFNAFLDSKGKEIKFENEKSIVILSIKKILEKNIEREEEIFKLLSPLVIRERKEKNKDWYHLLDNDGIAILKKNIIYNLKEYFPLEKLKEIEIIPLEVKKTVVLFYGIKFPVTTGIIKINAHKEILNKIYKIGLGSKASAGFGMLELL